MTESFNILEKLDSIDRIVEAIQQGKKVTLSALVETNPWVLTSQAVPKIDTLVVGTHQGSFFVTWLKEDRTWGNYVGQVDMWMYIPGLPQPENKVVVPVEVAGPTEEEKKEEVKEEKPAEQKVTKLKSKKSKK